MSTNATAVYRSEELDEEGLGYDLAGQRLNNFIGRRCFVDEEKYELQTPSIYPLGTLRYRKSAGINFLEIWVTEDESFLVLVDRDGTVDSIERYE